MKRARPTISVSRDFYAELVPYADKVDLPLSAIVEDAIIGVLYGMSPAEQTDLVERTRLNMIASGSAGPDRIRLTVPSLPYRPSGILPLRSTVTVEVSREMFGFVDDIVTRVRELEGREVSHSELFESAIKLALVAEQRKRSA